MTSLHKGLLLLLILVLLILSGWQPYDRATWLMEVAPVLIAMPLLALTHRRFPLTSLLYLCIALHAMVLMLGGAYTYARVPLGFELQQWLELSRNPYDKIGHFFQGFVPALVCREILLRGGYVQGRRMLAFLVVCVVLAISATYEFIEWEPPSRSARGRMSFSAPRATPGIPSPTCSSP